MTFKEMFTTGYKEIEEISCLEDLEKFIKKHYGEEAKYFIYGEKLSDEKLEEEKIQKYQQLEDVEQQNYDCFNLNFLNCSVLIFYKK